VDADPDDVFTDDPAGLWHAVLRRQPGELRLLATYPADPSLN
jgi:putative transcriptional regulator